MNGREVPLTGTYSAKGRIDHQDYNIRNERLRYSNTLQDDDNLITSLVVPQGPFDERKHKIMLDLDVPAKLVPSTTEGHTHLYIDIEVPDADYLSLLDVLAHVGIIERGYAQASQRRGHTSLRLPWVTKPSNSTPQ